MISKQKQNLKGLVYLVINFVQQKYNKKYLNQDIDNFHGRIKLSTHFGPSDTNKKQTEEDISKPPSNEKPAT